ncbi:MAG: PxKF domain-containing protein [Acidobacteria bacterium]|nr:PxKF domain-containing protein [Acidobacteriota bacterium]
MKSHTPPPHRTTTKTTSTLRRRHRLTALALALLLPAALLVWSGAAAAACNFLMTVASIGSANGQVLAPRGLATDSANNVYVADQANNRVQKFNSSGGFVLKFGSGGSANGEFLNAFGVALDSAGNIYVTDSAVEPRTTGYVQKFDSSGAFLAAWGTSSQFPNGAGGVAVDSASNVYVAQPSGNRIYKFTSTGTLITTLGSAGAGNGQFNGPTGLAIDAANNLYVSETGNNRVQVFDSTFTFVRKFGTAGTSDGQLNSPYALAVDASGNVYVADSGNNRIQKFDSSGAFVSACGTLAGGTGNDEFSFPQGIAVDGLGNTYVGDTGNDRVQKFGPAVATPPTANAGPDQTVECAGATTPVMLDGTGSTAGSGSINSYSWSEGSNPLGTGATLSVSLPAGSHTITLTVTDTGGGTDTDDVVVNIADTVAPVIHVNGANPMTVECHTTFTDPGATATDTCAGSVPVSSSGTVDANTPGTYTINYSATDGTHTATASRTVNVVDTTPPVISCPANIVVTLPPNSPATSAAVSYPAVTATDSCSSSVSVTSSPASGSVFPVGTTTVNATADDGNGHTASCSFTVTVRYNFTGFFQPVANPPTFNLVNAGRAIPVKFSLSGNKGLNIFAPGSPSSGPVACNSSDNAVTLLETVTAGGSGLSYDAGSDQYVYVWKTESSWAGTCRQLVVQLNDGSVHTAYFKFK